MTYEAHITMAFPPRAALTMNAALEQYVDAIKAVADPSFDPLNGPDLLDAAAVKMTSDDERARQHRLALMEKWRDLAKGYGWKTSAIDGDPLLGDGVHFYFTAHDQDANLLLRRMADLRYAILAVTGLEPVREKIEHVIYDTKTGADWRKLPQGSPDADRTSTNH